MTSKSDKQRTFPDFFESKDPIATTVVPLKFKDKLYWMLSANRNQNDNFIEQPSVTINSVAPYDDNDDGMIDCCDIEESYDIVPTKSGKFITSFYVPSALQSVIIGPRGQKLRTLEERTNTHIKVPRINEKGNVKITGPSERSVSSARNQVAMVVLNRREKLPVTHFLSIPIVSEEIANNFRTFQESILKGPAVRGLDESIFQKAEKLHLTIATLTLLDQPEIEEAIQVLQSCYKDVILPEFPKNQYFITMKGVEIMNDDPSDVNVLYGKVQLKSAEETAKFQTVCNEIVNYFYKKGLIKKQYDNVKLHVTLINSSFRKKTDDYERNQGNKDRESFEASDILKKYNDFNFGTTAFENFQLSIRFSTGKDGYYNSALTLTMV